jgi:hypothetical protein
MIKKMKRNFDGRGINLFNQLYSFMGRKKFSINECCFIFLSLIFIFNNVEDIVNKFIYEKDGNKLTY